MGDESNSLEKFSALILSVVLFFSIGAHWKNERTSSFIKQEDEKQDTGTATVANIRLADVLMPKKEILDMYTESLFSPKETTRRRRRRNSDHHLAVVSKSIC